MKNNLSIQFKAAFLLTVFSLNIVVGFACSIGIDMGFNKHHHDSEMAMAENSVDHHSMEASHSSHHHDEINNKDSKSDDDNCCKDKVTKLTTVDKSLPQSNKAAVNPIFFTSLISTFFQFSISYFDVAHNSNKFFVRSSPPTISDIRINIRSFQI